MLPYSIALYVIYTFYIRLSQCKILITYVDAALRTILYLGRKSACSV